MCDFIAFNVGVFHGNNLAHRKHFFQFERCLKMFEETLETRISITF